MRFVACSLNPRLANAMSRLSLRASSCLDLLATLLQALLVLMVAQCPQSFAQGFPGKTIRLIVPLAPGGGNDTAARVVGHKLGEALGQQVVVDNRPGGGSVIASEIAARAPADGHTLYLFSTNVTVAPALQKKLSFDTIRDFAPITRLTIAPGALIVHPSLPVKTVKDVIALAKAKPGQITFGSAGQIGRAHV